MTAFEFGFFVVVILIVLCLILAGSYTERILLAEIRKYRQRKRYYIRATDGAPLMVYETRDEAKESISFHGGRLIIVEEVEL